MNLKEKLNNLKNQLIKNQKEETNPSKRTTVVKSKDFAEKEKKMLDDFHQFREGYISEATASPANYFVNIRNISLNAKVDNFIDWHFQNMVKDNYANIGEFYNSNDMRNFIEKMAVWYELRYPDYEINRLMPCSGQEGIEISNVMFNSNKYINDLFDEIADIRGLDWDEFYNAKAFINSLPWDERYLFEKARYRNLVYI